MNRGKGDSNGNIVSNFPPYYFSIGNNISTSNNTIASVNLNLSTLQDTFVTVTIVDGNQQTSTSSFIANCINGTNLTGCLR